MSDDQNDKKKLEPTSSGQCIWVDAGVISYRLCTLNYQCERCSLHQALMDGPQLIRPMSGSVSVQDIEQQREDFKDLFDKLPAGARKCRYMLRGDVSYKLCINSFKCSSCSFAQMMEDSKEPDIEMPKEDEFVTGGLRLAGGMHYHRGHVWVHVERDGDIRVGVDDFSQRLLGTIGAVALPGPGDELVEGVAVCELQLEHGSIKIPTPLSGRIIAINKELVAHPGLVNDFPYTKGWLYTLRPSDLSFELKNLLYGHEARLWFEMETKRAIERIHGSGADKQRPDIEKGALWLSGRDDEMTGEFLLARTKKAA